jgi:hypothetical protein
MNGNRLEGRDVPGEPAEEAYEPPAIVFEKRIEAVANTCNFDPPLTKSNADEGCTGQTFS